MAFTAVAEQEDEEDAKLIANDNVFASCYSEADVEEVNEKV